MECVWTDGIVFGLLLGLVPFAGQRPALPERGDARGGLRVDGALLAPDCGWLLPVMNRYLANRKIVYSAPLVLFVLLYVGDFLWYVARSHFPSLGAATSSVHRIRLLAIPDKGNRVEYQIDAQQPEEDVPCARSLFSQGGNHPCWYVTRHVKDPIPM